MKKIFMGLMAVSAVSFAFDLNSPVANTNVFQTGQEGKIDVKGKLTSDIPVVRYVVFASNNGTYTGTLEEETLTLSDFIMSQEDSKANFTDTNPKVYVKRVAVRTDGNADTSVNGTGVGDLINDTVKFKLVLEPTRTAYSQNFFGNGGNVAVEPFALLSDSTLEDLNNALSLAGFNNFTIDYATGLLKVPDSYGRRYTYLIPKMINFASTENGVLEVNTVPTTSNINPLSNEISTVEAYFAGGKEFSTAVQIKVQVN